MQTANIAATSKLFMSQASEYSFMGIALGGLNIGLRKLRKTRATSLALAQSYLALVYHDMVGPFVVNET